MSNRKRNIVKEKSYAFAIRIVKLGQLLTNEKKEYVLSRQIIKSGTSIGANIEGISKKNFIAKMSIAYKEARETHYWLRILNDTNYLSDQEFKQLIAECDELLNLRYTIIQSSRNTN